MKDSDLGDARALRVPSVSRCPPLCSFVREDAITVAGPTLEHPALVAFASNCGRLAMCAPQ